MSALGGVCSRECLLQGVSALGGGCLLLGVGVCYQGGVCSGGGIPACTEADTHPVNNMTGRCKSITLATNSQLVTISTISTILCISPVFLMYLALFC